MSERSLFVAALEKDDPAERAAYLDQACAGDAALRQRLERLLLAHQPADSFLEAPAADLGATAAAPLVEGPGTRIGAYKLLQQIGEGGMGTVFMAEQTLPVQRRVALKIIKPGMDSRQVIARFEAERQALALMDHVNIARVLDGGTTENGRPYFVMELVHGVPITDFCDQNHLPVRQRLELVVSVCQAVQHAHQKGIIHRDLKPSNILVTLYDGQPVPKVIDFGVAKATEQRLTEKTLFTQYGTMVGTLEYMSPEQAAMSALGVDTRSDIYSLGVLLYELLTGSTPLSRQRLKDAAFDEVLRMIKEEEPPKPSTRLSDSGAALASISAQRHTEPAKLTKLVRGELDWIVMKTLEKDRNRRYETANGLAMDLQRHLQDEPVQACPPSAGYRLGKFVRRNRVALTSTGLVLLILLTLTGGIGWNVRDRAARQAEIDREVNGALDQASLWRDQGQWPDAKAAAQRAGELMAQGASSEQQRRLSQLLTDLTLVARLEEIGLRPITEKQDTEASLQVGRAYAAAFQDYGIDLAALDPAVAAERVRASAISEQLLAALDDWNRYNEAYVIRIAANQILRREPQTITGTSEQKPDKGNPGAGNVPFEHVRTVARLADRDEWRNRIRALASRYGQLDRQVVEELASKPEAAALPPAPALLLAAALRRVGAREKALEILYAAQQHAPADLRLNVELALHSQLTLDESSGFLRAALALRPQSPGLHFSLGDRLLTRGALDQAITAFRNAVELKSDYTDAYFKLGIALGRKRAWDDALAAYGKAIQLDRDLPDPHYQRGRVYAELGQWGMAAADYQRAAELYPQQPERWCEHAGVLLLAGKHKPYRELCDRVLEMVRKGNTLGAFRIVVTFQGVGARTAYLAARTCVLAPDAIEDPAPVVRLAEQAVMADPPCAWYLHTLGMAHYRAGDFDQAIRRLRESLDAKPAWPANVMNWLGLAMVYHRLGQTEEARQCLDKALQWIDKATPKSSQEALGSIPGLDSAHDWLACHVLRREAEALLDAKARPTPNDK